MRNILFGLWVLGGLSLFTLAVAYGATSYRFKAGAVFSQAKSLVHPSRASLSGQLLRSCDM